MSWQNEHEITAPESLDQHRNSDVDGGPKSQHHTLGTGQHQAAPGKLFANLKYGLEPQVLQVSTNAVGEFTISHKLKVLPTFANCQAQTGNWLIFRIVAVSKTQVTFKTYDVAAGAVFASMGPFTVNVLVLA